MKLLKIEKDCKKKKIIYKIFGITLFSKTFNLFWDTYITKYKILFIKIKSKKPFDESKYAKDFYNIIIRKNTSDNLVFKSIMECEQYKPLCCSKNTKFIIDAGANIGCTSIYLAQKYEDAKIFSIEPDSSNFDILVENVKQYKNIIPIKAGLWYKTTKLNVIDNGFGKWGMQTSEAVGKIKNTSIDAITINDIIRDYNIDVIDILKIDIEGAEKEIFNRPKDELDWLNKVKIISVELHDRMVEGTSNAFFKAFSDYPFFELSINSEDLILINKNIK